MPSAHLRNWDVEKIPFYTLNIMLRLTEPKPMSEAGLRDFINRALDRGFVREGFHSEVERADRDISDEDIRYGLSLKSWVLKGLPKPSKTGGFKYLIKTVDIENAELHLLVKPETGTSSLKILTKY
jgi:hypothetical protein